MFSPTKCSILVSHVNVFRHKRPVCLRIYIVTGEEHLN